MNELPIWAIVNMDWTGHSQIESWKRVDYRVMLFTSAVDQGRALQRAAYRLMNSMSVTFVNIQYLARITTSIVINKEIFSFYVDFGTLTNHGVTFAFILRRNVAPNRVGRSFPSHWSASRMILSCSSRSTTTIDWMVFCGVAHIILAEENMSVTCRYNTYLLAIEEAECVVLRL